MQPVFYAQDTGSMISTRLSLSEKSDVPSAGPLTLILWGVSEHLHVRSFVNTMGSHIKK